MIPSWRTTAFLVTLIVFLNKWHLKKVHSSVWVCVIMVCFVVNVLLGYKCKGGVSGAHQTPYCFR
jgi:hypothetical protein